MLFLAPTTASLQAFSFALTTNITISIYVFPKKILICVFLVCHNFLAFVVDDMFKSRAVICPWRKKTGEQKAVMSSFLGMNRQWNRTGSPSSMRRLTVSPALKRYIDVLKKFLSGWIFNAFIILLTCGNS